MLKIMSLVLPFCFVSPSTLSQRSTLLGSGIWSLPINALGESYHVPHRGKGVKALGS